MAPTNTEELYDETKTTAIHLIRGWNLTNCEQINVCFADEDFILAQKEALNSYSTLFLFSKHQLPIWLRITNQTALDALRFNADGFHNQESSPKWQLDIAIPIDSVRLLHSIEQAIFALTTGQAEAHAQRIVVRPYQALWKQLKEAKVADIHNHDEIQKLTLQLEQDAIRWLIKPD